MRILFFNHEQYGYFLEEAGNHEMRLPILRSGVVSAHMDYVYQRVLRKSGMDEAIKGAFEAVADFDPDLVVFIATWPHECLPASILELIEQKGVPVLSIIADTSIDAKVNEKFASPYFKGTSYFCDGGSFFGFARYRLWSEFMKYKKGLLFLPGNNVVTERFIRPPQEQDINVALIGSLYKHRAEMLDMINRLLSSKHIEVKQIGGLVDETIAHPFLGRAGQWVPENDYVSYIHRTKILLCPSGPGNQWGVRGKIFEFLAAGAFCLVESNPDTMFTIPKGVIETYTTVEECAEKIVFYCEDDSARRARASTGRMWFYDTFDYKRYWKEVFTGIKGRETVFTHTEFVEQNYQIARERTVQSLQGVSLRDALFEGLEFSF